MRTKSVPNNWRAHALTACAPDGLVAVGRDWRICSVSDESFGLVTEDAVGHELWACLPVEIGSPAYVCFRKAMESGKPEEFLDFHPPTQQWLMFRASTWGEGLIIAYRAIPQHPCQAHLPKCTWQVMRAVIEHLPVGVWLLDGAGQILASNPDARRIWGGALHVGPDEFGKLKGWYRATGEAVTEWSSIRAVRDRTMVLDEEIDILCLDGATRKTIRHSAIPLTAADGSHLGAIVVDQDITQDRQDQHALETARQDADRAELARSQVVAALAHDLIQPILGVRLHLSGVLPALPPEHAETVKVAIASLMQAEQMAESLMECAALEATDWRAVPAEVDLDRILLQVCAETAATAWARGLGLRYRASRRPRVTTDPSLLQRAVRNLITNAVRYTTAGGVLIALRTRRGRPVIQVWDTGMGIDPTALANYLKDGTLVQDRHRKGMGIGLQTVWKIANALNLRITARSMPGRGSMFRLEFPAGAETSQPIFEKHITSTHAR